MYCTQRTRDDGMKDVQKGEGREKLDGGMERNET
jgi:hypothetical protein